MKKNIENWIENKIGWISLVLAILSLTSTFLLIYRRGSRSIMWFSSRPTLYALLTDPFRE